MALLQDKDYDVNNDPDEKKRILQILWLIATVLLVKTMNRGSGVQS